MSLSGVSLIPGKTWDDRVAVGAGDINLLPRRKRFRELGGRWRRLSR